MSPARFARLHTAWERKEARMDRRFALLACLLANIHRAPGTEPFDLEDFLPMKASERASREKEKERRTWDAIQAAGNNWHGGKP